MPTDLTNFRTPSGSVVAMRRNEPWERPLRRGPNVIPGVPALHHYDNLSPALIWFSSDAPHERIGPQMPRRHLPCSRSRDVSRAPPRLGPADQEQ